MIAKLLAWLIALPVVSRDKAELPEAREIRLQVVAIAIVDASAGNHYLAAAVAVQGREESFYGLDWGSCHCLVEKGECDHGKAHGYWQWHKLPSETKADHDGLCSVSDEATQIAAARAASWLKGCAGGDRDCLAGKYSRLGGLSSLAAPEWAFDRADKAAALAETISPAARKKELRKSKKKLPISNS